MSPAAIKSTSVASAHGEMRNGSVFNS